mmetsp:Transcript_9167/g.17253  ORF Transcript_9167/g.17253 Transcript_9167/m.17253 type:complete len:570 (+) Transcript_9167:1-1710(+)
MTTNNGNSNSSDNVNKDHVRHDDETYTNTNTNNDDNTTDPFALIEKGYEYQEESPWESAYYFLQASTVLHSKARRLIGQQQQQHQQQYCKDYKTQKIAALYEDQGNFYMSQARKTVIVAMQRELDDDEKSLQSIPSRVEAVKYLAGELLHEDDYDDDDVTKMENIRQRFEPKMNCLSRETLEKRRMLLCKLFAKDVEEKEDKVKEEEAKGRRSCRSSTSSCGTSTNGNPNLTSTNNMDKVLSLEERLALLNSSMGECNIQQPKTDEQRLKELHKSLSGLGVTIPYNTTTTTNGSLSYHETGWNEYISEDDAIDEIINMAKDEVSLMKNLESERSTRDGDEGDVLTDLIRNASVRLNIIDSDHDNGDDDDGPFHPTATTDAQMKFWEHLKIDNNEHDADAGTIEPTSNDKMEQMKQYLETAQQLLLQASICIEELRNEGYSMDKYKEEMPLGQAKDNKQHGQDRVMESMQESNDDLQNQHVSNEDDDDDEHLESCVEQLCQEGTTIGTSSKVHTPGTDTKDDMDTNQAQGSDNRIVTNLVQTGKSSLEDALEKVEKVRSMWSSIKLFQQQ